MGVNREVSGVDRVPPSDADRAAAVSLLRDQLAADRLTLPDFERHVEQVYSFTTLVELLDFCEHFTAPAPPARQTIERPGRLAVFVVALLFAVGTVAVVGLTRSDDAAPRAPVVTQSQPESPATVPAILDRARLEGWFDGCRSSNDSLRGRVPSSETLDILPDAVPDGMVEQYRVGNEGPIEPESAGGNWTTAALLEVPALQAHAATFNDGPPGPGGWAVYAVRFERAEQAERALELSHHAFVCQFGADPWTPTRVPGAVAATHQGNLVEIAWTTDDVLIVVDWSIFQDPAEAQDRAESAAAAVRGPR